MADGLRLNDRSSFHVLLSCGVGTRIIEPYYSVNTQRNDRKNDVHKPKYLCYIFTAEANSNDWPLAVNSSV